jgi:hypothetical protein
MLIGLEREPLWGVVLVAELRSLRVSVRHAVHCSVYTANMLDGDVTDSKHIM